MEIRVLRYFWTVAEEGTVSRGAEVLHITQPTLSRQLINLEEELGTQLFVRKKKRLILTKAGMYLKDRAEEILALTDQTTQEFEDQKGKMFSGTVSVGCVETGSTATLAVLLEEFASEFPLVKFNIFSGTSKDISEKLDKGLLDIGLLLGSMQTEKYDSVSFVHRENWGMLVDKTSSIASREQLKPEDLVDVPLLCSARSDVQKMFEEWMGTPFKELDLAGTFNLIFNVIPLVEKRIGVALTVEGAVTNLKNGRTKFIPLSPSVSTGCVAVWKKNRAFSPAASKFIQKMRDIHQE